MFPEFRDLISTLKTEDAHFARLFERHNDLDQQIASSEAASATAAMDGKNNATSSCHDEKGNEE